MKYLLVIAVVAVFYLYWKKQRRAASPPPAADRALPPLQPMVACAHCGLHLPARDALTDGTHHSYCCTAHQQQGPRP